MKDKGISRMIKFNEAKTKDTSYINSIFIPIMIMTPPLFLPLHAGIKLFYSFVKWRIHATLPFVMILCTAFSSFIFGPLVGASRLINLNNAVTAKKGGIAIESYKALSHLYDDQLGERNSSGNFQKNFTPQNST
jgi:hypothetical protein